MREKVYWMCKQINWFIIRCLHVVTRKYYVSKTKYGRHTLHSIDDGNDKVIDLIRSGKPFAFGREGYVELNIAVRTKTKELFGFDTFWMMKDYLHAPYRYAGGKKKYSGTIRYGELVQKSIKNMDVLGIWDNATMGDALIDLVDPLQRIYITDAGCCEPYTLSEPWFKELSGKRVLVVSPFYKEITYQYNNNRDKIWDNPNILPEFELIAIDSIWFLEPEDSEYDDWYSALDTLYSRIVENEFDIALLSCGPFGLPLVSMIKDMGKQAIYMGGTLQLMFGIKGKRWDDSGLGDYVYNEYWIRPGDDTKPKHMNRLDEGCYW